MIDALLYNVVRSLPDVTIDAIAAHIAAKTDFGMVQSVSDGGQRLADAVEPYAVFESPFQILLIDDVCATGASMEAAKAAQPPQVHPADVVGFVIFARGRLPSWVNAVFWEDCR